MPKGNPEERAIWWDVAEFETWYFQDAYSPLEYKLTMLKIRFMSWFWWEVTALIYRFTRPIG